jgi:hypothetical protein
MFGPPIGEVKLYMILKNLKVYPFLTLVVWACRVDRCANILAHRCPPPPIGNGDQAQCANKIFFMFGPPLLLGPGCIGAPIVLGDYK